MGHLTSKDLYQKLGKRLDQASIRTPWTPVFAQLVEYLYTPTEAELISRLPYRPSTLTRIAHLTKSNKSELRKILEQLCTKGLIIDIWNGQEYLYMVSPIVIGFFEFTMMRTGVDLPLREWAELFQAYMFDEKAFLAKNFDAGQMTSVMRALPHEEALGEHVEILDYEKAACLIEEHSIFSLGLCSCRHEKHHLGHAACRTPMETCTSMGSGAERLIRLGFARRIDKFEMRDILARSREQGLTLSADNVRNDVGFICHCCGCCCNLMRAVRETGYTGILVTSTCIAHVNQYKCTGCGLCAKVCPINAISIQKRPLGESSQAAKKLAHIDQLCLGCGACALRCPTAALSLKERDQKVLHPEDSFERIMLQSLERDTFQTFIFDNPASKTQAFMRGLVGGFLKLAPIKRALLSEKLRSRFLSALRKAAD